MIKDTRNDFEKTVMQFHEDLHEALFFRIAEKRETEKLHRIAAIKLRTEQKLCTEKKLSAGQKLCGVGSQNTDPKSVE
jgi:hypothetical protein